MNTNDINNEEQDDFTNGLIIMKNLAWYNEEEEIEEERKVFKPNTSSREMMQQLPVPEAFYYELEPQGNYQQYLKDNGYIK